ncbi:reverse transcriptase domain-containing protein [Tanacetum coccineum]
MEKMVRSGMAERGDGAQAQECNQIVNPRRFLVETQEEDNEAAFQKLLKKNVLIQPEARSMIKEIYKGSCGLHTGPRSIVAKITMMGYCWPSMHKDASEAKPLASVTWKHIERFIWEHVKCLFVMPQMIVSDNRKQFEEGAFPQLCERFMIKQAFTSEYGQQGSRLTERVQVEIRKKLRLALLMERKQFHKKKPTSQQEKKLTLSKL